MNQQKNVLTIGACVMLFAFVLRFGLLPLQDSDALSLLVYFQTGRLVRYSSTEVPSSPTTPTVSTSPTVPVIAPSGLILTKADAQAVEVNDLAEYRPDVEKMLLSPLPLNLRGEKPTVLILHTHATESYTQQPGEIYEEDSAYRTFNASYNMLSIGEELARILEEGGITVLHDRTIHDYPSYSGSYDHARETIAAYLNAYPSIQLVIDLHRDALDLEEDPQLTTMATVNGEKSAQLMLVAGTDRNVSYPRWQENLSLGIKLTATLEKMHPGITRPIQLRRQRYNLDMTTGSLLVEVGANGNTHQEAMRAVRALGEAILAMADGVNL